MTFRKRSAGFTLIELVASAAVITLLMLMLVQMSRSTAETWKKGMSRSEEFRESRRAYEMVTRRLATATLNTYVDYRYDSSVDTTKPIPITAIPKGYQRQSDLRFRVLPMADLARETGFHPTFGVFFQAPSATVDMTDTYWTKPYANKTDLAPVTRLDGMLNTWGYFLEVGDSNATMPAFLKANALPHYRSRLMEYREDCSKLSVYKLPSTTPRDDWFTVPIADTSATRPAHVVAENIIALVLLPRLAANDEAARRANTSIGIQYQYLSPTFSYDSRKINNYGGSPLPPTALPNQINPFNQLPPVVEVAMVALDQTAANRLGNEASDKSKLDLDQLMDGLFLQADSLEPHDTQPGDLATLEKRLLDRHLGYRIFTSNVSIRGARWSAAETDQ